MTNKDRIMTIVQDKKQIRIGIPKEITEIFNIKKGQKFKFIIKINKLYLQRIKKGEKK